MFEFDFFVSRNIGWFQYFIFYLFIYAVFYAVIYATLYVHHVVRFRCIEGHVIDLESVFVNSNVSKRHAD